MGVAVKIAEALYTEWRRRQPDPTQHPAWGNLDTEQRGVWEHVAETARDQCASIVAGYRCVCGRDHTFELAADLKARKPVYCPGCGADTNPLNQHERDSSQACICSGLDVCECGHERDDHPRGICWTNGCGCSAFKLKARAE